MIESNFHDTKTEWQKHTGDQNAFAVHAIYTIITSVSFLQMIDIHDSHTGTLGSHWFLWWRNEIQPINWNAILPVRMLYVLKQTLLLFSVNLRCYSQLFFFFIQRENVCSLKLSASLMKEFLVKMIPSKNTSLFQK